MANGITVPTREDRAIQGGRFLRCSARESLRAVGYCVGWGYEADFLDANAISNRMRYQHWLRSRAPFNGRTHAVRGD